MISVNKPSALHDAGHSLGLWLFSGTTPWFEFVLHAVLVGMPLALVLVIVTWLHRLFRHVARKRQDRAPSASSPASSRAAPTGVFRYILRHTRRSQFSLLATALVALPLLYAGLELPKLIINNAISSGHFPLDFLTLSISQTTYLFLLSTIYLAVILVNGSLKYAINLHKGRVAESLLQRLRLTIYRHWRRDSSHDDRSAVIPMLVQEVEPIGGFAGDAFVLPLFQGGTFLTILLFMFLQDPVLGAAAITLLPVQLALIPRLQRRINDLARRRAYEMRGLGSAIGREIASQSDEAGESRRQIAGTVRRLAAVRFEIYRKKFFMKGLNNFITQLTPFFFYTVGGYLVIEDRLSFGALVAVLAAHKDFSAPLKELLRYYQTMEDVRVRFDETQQFLLERTAPRGSQRCSPSSVKGLTPTPLRGRSQYVMPQNLPAIAQRLTALQQKRAVQPCRAQHRPP